MQKIAILGSGKFGSAIAFILDKTSEFKISLYTILPSVVESINMSHINSECFSDKIFSNNTTATMDLNEAISETEYIFLAIPSINIIQLLTEISKHKLLINSKIIIEIPKSKKY